MHANHWPSIPSDEEHIVEELRELMLKHSDAGGSLQHSSQCIKYHTILYRKD